MALNIGRQAVSGAAWVTVELVSIQAISLLLFVVMAHYLDPTEFGLLAICLVLMNSCKSIIVDNFVVAVTRKPDATAAEYSTAFWITSGMALLVFLFLQLFASAADTVFNSAGMGRVLRVTSVMLLVQGIARTQEAWLGRHFMFRILAIRSLVAAVIAGVVGVVMAMNGFGVWALVAQQVLTSAVAFLLLWFSCPWRPGFDVSMRSAREIVGFSWSLIGSGAAYAFQQNCDTLLIGATFGPSSAGLYNVAKRLRLALQMGAVTPINVVTSPALVEAQREPGHFLTAFLTANFVVFVFSLPTFLGAAAVSHDAILLLFGSRWIEAAPIFSWLALGGLCAVATDYISNVLIIRGKPVFTLVLAVVNVILILALFWLGANQDPALMALPFVLPYAVVLPLAVTFLRRTLRIPAWDWIRSLLPPIVAVSSMLLTLHLLAPAIAAIDLPTWGRLTISICSAALVYGAVLILFKPSLIGTVTQLIRPGLRS